ncbi:MAG: hypothetical protein NDJ89_07775 [Oligoflexia bacterium]|nr:hypothetical protein [Oligoflexia bacterium]
MRTGWRFVVAFTGVALLLLGDLFVIGPSIDVYRNEDENWYGIVLERLETDGCETGIPVTFVHQERKVFQSCEFFKVLNAVTPGPLKAPVLKALWLKGWARVLLLGLFSVLSMIVLGTPWPGLLAGAWNLVDPGVESFKPGGVVASQLAQGIVIPFTQAERFISPAHYALPGYAALAILLAWIRRDRPDPLLALPLGGSLWLLALTPFYAWLPFYFAFGCAGLYSLLFCRKETRLAVLGALGGGALLIGIYLRAKAGFPFEEQVLPRSGFFKDVHAPIFVLHKGLLLATLCVAGMAHFVFGRRPWATAAVSLGFYGLQNVNVLTGYELQNFHFKDYLGPFFLLSAVFFAYARWPAWRKRGAVVALSVIALGLLQQGASLARYRSPLRTVERHADHRALVEYARAELRGKRGFCGEWNLQLPVLAGVSCYYHHLLMTYPLEDTEVLEMTMVRFRLLGLSPEEVRAELEKARADAPIAAWNYGTRPEWLGGNRSGLRYWEEAPRFIPRWVEEYARLQESRLIEAARDFDFLILPKSHPLVTSGEFPALREFGDFGVYRGALSGGRQAATGMK